jgi:hypothetical protein
MRGARKLAAAAAATAASVMAAVVLVASNSGTKSMTSTASANARTRAARRSVAPSTGPSSSRSSSTAAAVVQAFASSYAAYLDGAHARLTDTSLTATGEAQQAGRIPVSFRDGDLRVTGETALQATCCSAQQTVTLANRQESYPFTVQLLDDGPRGWQIASLAAPDLSMDDHLQPLKHDTQPTVSGRQAARQFAIAYTAFKAGTSAEPSMNAQARRELAASQDSLAGAEIPKGAISLQAIKFGPPTGSEFAATASVKVAGRSETFTFLMVRQNGQWLAGAFL